MPAFNEMNSTASDIFFDS